MENKNVSEYPYCPYKAKEILAKGLKDGDIRFCTVYDCPMHRAKTGEIQKVTIDRTKTPILVTDCRPE